MAEHTDPMTGLSRCPRIVALMLLAALCGTPGTAHSQTRSAFFFGVKLPRKLQFVHVLAVDLNSAIATPATHMIDGKQCVVVSAGGGKDPKGWSGTVYVAFGLP
jgi:hypothetical protein